MAQYFNDFGQYEIGSPPNDFTSRWNGGFSHNIVSDATVSNGQAYSMVVSSFSDKLVSWDVLDSDLVRADFEILYRWRTSGSSSVEVCGGMAGRCTIDSGYSFAHRSDNLIRRQIAFVQSGSKTIVGEFAGSSLAPLSTYKYSRCRVQGNTMKFKTWHGEATDEPNWQVETTDNTIADAGFIGIYNRRSTNIYDFISVGTGGDIALFTSNGGDPPPTEDKLRRRLQASKQYFSQMRRW